MTAEKQKMAENTLQILIATDKFKGSLTSAQAAEGIRKGMVSRIPGLSFDVVEIADGGDGSAGVVKKQAAAGGGCCEISCTAVNPVGKKIHTSYIWYGETAFIEMARVSGLELLSPDLRNPLETTTYGLGEVIRHALESGAGEIILSIGGSATNDGGTGMLQALGFQFRDASGMLLGTPYLCGKELERIAAVVIPENLLINKNGKKPLLKVICDVTNPLLGPNGATWVYGAQKGADTLRQQRLEAGMEQYVRAEVLLPDKGLPASAADAARLAGSGAAGGVGFAATYYLAGELISGWRFFADITRLEERIACCDLVISGEGRIDSQSFQGKVIDGVSSLARKHHKPLLLFCGSSELPGSYIASLPDTRLYALCSLEPDTARSMIRAGELLAVLAAGAVQDLPGRIRKD